VDPFELPDDLTTLTATELSDLESQAIAAFDGLRSIAEEDLTDDDVAAMESLAEDVATIRAAQDTLVQARSARADRAAAAAQALAPAEPPPADDEVVEVEVVEDDTDDDTITVETPAVAASARRTSLVRTADKRPVPQPRNHRAITLTAAADIPGVPVGHTFEDLDAVTAAFIARSKGLPQTRIGDGIQQRYGVATFHRDFDGMIDTNPDYRTEYDLVMAASREARLPGGSLLAAGGWCAPSETFYDLCANESMDGLVDLPEIGLSRGGMRFTTGPDFSDIYTDAGFCLTEAQAIAGTTKPCVDVECPPFDEVRLDVCGVCIRANLLMNSAYPELVRRWIDGSLVAHAHKVSSRLISAMATDLAATAQTMPDTGSVSHSALTAVELAAEGLRYQWRMAFNETLEVIAPHWLLAAIRADLSIRTGRDQVNVTDAEINSHFANRGVRVQWVYDWQPLLTKCPTAFPSTAELLIYPAGTFVKGTADVISLDTVYDTTSLQANTFTALFTEEGILVARTCFDGCRLSIPVCPSGRTGAADMTACYGAATP